MRESPCNDAPCTLGPKTPGDFELFPKREVRDACECAQKRTLTHNIDTMDPSKFTEKTIQALNAAQELAVESGHQQVCRFSS